MLDYVGGLFFFSSDQCVIANEHQTLVPMRLGGHLHLILLLQLLKLYIDVKKKKKKIIYIYEI